MSWTQDLPNKIIKSDPSVKNLNKIHVSSGKCQMSCPVLPLVHAHKTKINYQKNIKTKHNGNTAGPSHF